MVTAIIEIKSLQIDHDRLNGETCYFGWPDGLHFFKSRCHVLVAFSVGCQFYRLLRSEMGHSLFYFF